MTDSTEPRQEPESPVPECKPEGGGAVAPCEVDEGGAVVGFNFTPANSAHDKAALARYLEQWRARRPG